MNAAASILDVVLAITFTMVAQMKLAVASLPQTASRGGGRMTFWSAFLRLERATRPVDPRTRRALDER